MSDRAHVKVYRHPEGHGWAVELNGERIENYITPDGLRLEFESSNHGPSEPKVYLTIVPEEIEMDLPDALVDAVRGAPVEYYPGMEWYLVKEDGSERYLPPDAVLGAMYAGLPIRTRRTAVDA